MSGLCSRLAIMLMLLKTRGKSIIGLSIQIMIDSLGISKMPPCKLGEAEPEIFSLYVTNFQISPLSWFTAFNYTY